MNKKPKYLNSYEEDLIWMSYRYCIGSHTIATHMHAGNIVKNAYAKLNPERRNFMAFDIRREIANRLGIYTPSFVINSNLCNQDNTSFKPLELYIDYINGKSIEDIKNISCITYDGSKYIELPNVDNTNKYFYITNVDDLITWMDVASCFDVNSHETCKVKNPHTGEITEVEYFWSYIKSYSSNDVLNYEKIRRPVSKYVENPIMNTYINEELIVK